MNVIAEDAGCGLNPKRELETKFVLLIIGSNNVTLRTLKSQIFDYELCEYDDQRITASHGQYANVQNVL